MDTGYSAIEGRSRKYITLVVILVVLALGGLASFVIRKPFVNIPSKSKKGVITISINILEFL